MMLSMVMPFYQRAAVFRETFAANRRFIPDNAEVVVVMDDPEGAEEVVAFAGQQAGKWLVVLNELAHAWRNPAKAINVGIRLSAGSHILVVSPETEFLTDVPGVLFTAATERPTHYHFGEITMGKFTYHILTLRANDWPSSGLLKIIGEGNIGDRIKVSYQIQK
jgi:hypothetical protein